MTFEESRTLADAVQAMLSPTATMVSDYWHTEGNEWAVRLIARKDLRTFPVYAQRVGMGGEMDLPLSSVGEAWEEANRIAEACGYMARRVKRGDWRGVQVWLQEGPAVVAWWDSEGFVGVGEVSE